MYDTSLSTKLNRKSVSESARGFFPGKAEVMACILIVEDEVDLRDMLSETLEQSGYRTVVADTVGEARRQLEQSLPDLVLLDWMLPDTTGVKWLRQIRRIERFRSLPVIMLTARGEVGDRVSGLDSGADDYIVKPFSLKELQARIRAQLRKQLDAEELEQFVAGDLVLDTGTHRVMVAGVEIPLGPTEFRLLQHFIMHPDRVYSRSQLLDSVWGQQVFIEERTVDVHIRRLRKVLEPVGKASLIQTVRGAGYRFSPGSA
jgi:two-component system phosphate regulon response regulator PhoB